MRKCEDNSRSAPLGNQLADAPLNATPAGAGAERLEARSNASMTTSFLQLTNVQATTGSASASLLLFVLTITFGMLPAPAYALPAFLCGWGRCRAHAALAIIALTAGASTLGANPWPFVTTFLLGAAVQVMIWRAALAARMAYEGERSSARMDGLTGCLTLKAFHEELAVKLVAAKDQRKPVALAYLDLDQFKEVNDRYGHAVGDELLRSFATELRAHLLQDDVVGGLEVTSSLFFWRRSMGLARSSGLSSSCTRFWVARNLQLPRASVLSSLIRARP